MASFSTIKPCGASPIVSNYHSNVQESPMSSQKVDKQRSTIFSPSTCRIPLPEIKKSEMEEVYQFIKVCKSCNADRLLTFPQATALAGNLKALQGYHKKRADEVMQCYQNGSLMHYAAMEGQIEFLEWLHEQDPSLITRSSECDFSVAHVAFCGSLINLLERFKLVDEEVLEQFKSVHKELSKKRINSMDVDFNASIVLLKWLEKHAKEELSKISKYRGFSTMHMAVITAPQDHLIEILNFLHKVNDSLIYTPSCSGLLPIHYAAKQGNAKAVEWFCDHDESGVFTQSRDNKGRTPMHHAAGKDHLEVVQLLYEIDPGVIEETNLEGKTPLDLAIDQEDSKTAGWLLKILS